VQVTHVPDAARAAHLEEARRVLALPLSANALRWHPFGVYAIPLARRGLDGQVWSRRLHLWHPDAEPVGERSPYGVHTHTGRARSHVLVGTLHHHLYAFAADEDGAWQRAALGVPEGRAAMLAHVQAPTPAATTHELPADHPHGVTKPPGWAVSLFEQMESPGGSAFTTWRRLGGEPEEPDLRGPVPPGEVLREARALVEQALG